MDTSGGGGGGGGFLPDDGAEMGGGFFPEPTSGDNGGGGGGGGFLPEDYSTSGGFLPDDDTSGGGFLPDPSPQQPQQFGSYTLYSDPSPPPLPPLPSERIPLSKIPQALQLLNLPSTSRDLLELFKDAAEEDENGQESVDKEKFRKVCEALLDDEDEDEDEHGSSSSSLSEIEEGEGEGEESEGYIDEEGVANSTRRSTRNTRSTARDSKGRGKAIDQDLPSQDIEISLPADFSDSSLSSSSSTSSTRRSKSTSSKSKSKKLSSSSSKTTKRRPRHDGPLSNEELQEARDSFDLFFATGAPIVGEKTIGLTELRNVSKLLGEKLGDEEVRFTSFCLRWKRMGGKDRGEKEMLMEWTVACR